LNKTHNLVTVFHGFVYRRDSEKTSYSLILDLAVGAIYFKDLASHLKNNSEENIISYGNFVTQSPQSLNCP